jgi:hypothetical protein
MKDFIVQVNGPSELLEKMLQAFPSLTVVDRVSPDEIHVGANQAEEGELLEWMQDGMTCCVIN